MARKRASLKDKGEEILGGKRGGKGADILFGGGTEAEPTAEPEKDSTPARSRKRGRAKAAAPPAEKSPPEGEAEEAKGDETSSAVAEYPAVEEGLPQGEADLDEEFDLDSLLGAEAEAAEGEGAWPDLATTPAAPAPPSPEATIPPSTAPPAVERPLPAPPPITPPAPPQGGPTGMPPAVERPLPAPLPITPPAPPQGGPTGMPPSDSRVPPRPAPAVAPPSTATGAPDLSVRRPPRYIQMVEDDFDLLAEEISDDAAAAALIGAPEAVRLTAEQRAELLRRRSVLAKLAELDKEIDGQYDRILQENISVNKSITDWSHNMLAEARAIVLNREVGKLAKAEWNVEQVRARLDRAGESRKQANRYAWLIAVWGVVWFGVFVYLIFNPMFILLLLNIGDFSDQFIVPEIFLRSLFFGGIGGVAAVFYHLFKYMRQRSFDSQYVLSYVGKPFMGMILGTMVYLTIFVAMRVLGLAPIGFQQEGTQAANDVLYMALLYFVALAAGFKENLAFNLLNRVIKAVLGREEKEEEVSEPPPAMTATTP